MPKQIYQSNSVEVLGSGGLMRYGRVVEVTDNGFFVDFLCDQQRRQFFAFDSDVFLSDTKRCIDIEALVRTRIDASNIPIEALMREEPGLPWTWYPAEMLVTERGPRNQRRDMATVRWGNNRGRIDIVPFERIRKRVASAKEPTLSVLKSRKSGGLPQRVSRETFKHTIPFPSDCRSQLYNNPPLPIPDEDTPSVLPELWVEVFSHLDTFTQTQLRAVCSLWADLFLSPALTNIVRVSTLQSSSVYSMLSPICRCLSASTQRVIIDNRPHPLMQYMLFKVLDLIRCVAQHNPDIRLDTIYLLGWHCTFDIGPSQPMRECGLHGSSLAPTQLRVGEDDFHSIRLEDFLATCRMIPCQAIQWIDSRIQLNDATFWYRDAWQGKSADISACRMSMNSLECALWEAFEKGFPEPEAEKLQKLGERLTGMRDNVNRSEFIGMLLCATQTADPRPALNYRGKKWCVDGWQDFRVENLSRIALHFLIENYVDRRVLW